MDFASDHQIAGLQLPTPSVNMHVVAINFDGAESWCEQEIGYRTLPAYARCRFNHMRDKTFRLLVPEGKLSDATLSALLKEAGYQPQCRSKLRTAIKKALETHAPVRFELYRKAGRPPTHPKKRRRSLWQPRAQRAA